MPLNTRQRRDWILTEILEKGHVQVKDLAPQMEVSEATVRRDLRALADEGQLELVYGGATLPRKTDYSFNTKSVLNIDAKRAIGRLAAEFVQDGDQIFLDSGTTTREMAPHLRRRRGLSVIVNSARLAMDLGEAGDLSVIALGGQYRPDRMDTVGPLATATLEQLRGYIAFVGADGLSRDFGVTAADIESAHLYRLAIRNARETVLLVDHTKMMSPSLYKITDFETISRVITDQPPDPAWHEYFEENAIEVVWPDKTASPAMQSADHESATGG